MGSEYGRRPFLPIGCHSTPMMVTRQKVSQSFDLLIMDFHFNDNDFRKDSKERTRGTGWPRETQADVEATGLRIPASHQTEEEAERILPRSQVGE